MGCCVPFMTFAVTVARAFEQNVKSTSRTRFNVLIMPWTYGLDGRLLGAPNMQGGDGFDKVDYPLFPVAIAEWEGFLFLNLAPDPQPFHQAYAPLLGKFQQWHLPDLAVAHRIKYLVQANWKLLFQNYSEC